MLMQKRPFPFVQFLGSIVGLQNRVSFNAGFGQSKKLQVAYFSNQVIINEQKKRLVGKTLFDCVTPSLFIDLDAFERNCKKLKTVMNAFPNVKIRPHTKAHKTAQIAQKQLQVLGEQGQGVCCQTVAEAEEMVRGGVSNVFVSNQIVGINKVLRLVRLAQLGAAISVCVDDELNLKQINSCAHVLDTNVDIVIECNVGQNRCGVHKVEDAIHLASIAQELTNVNFVGLQGYHGKLQHIRDPKQRKEAVEKVIQQMRYSKQALKDAGYKVDIVTGGGSGTYRIEAASGLYTEVQPGSFCFGDVDYSKNIQEDGDQEWEFSLFILSSVISRNKYLSHVVLDAGSKAISYDSGSPLVKVIHDAEQLAAYAIDHEHLEAENGGDEHTIVHWPSTWQTGKHDLPAVGAHVILVPGHCDPTLNMYDSVILIRDGIVEDVLRIGARGPGC